MKKKKNEEKCDHLKFEDILKECKDDKIRAILVFIEEKFGIKGVDVEKEDELSLVTDDGTELTIYKGHFWREAVDDETWTMHKIDLNGILTDYQKQVEKKTS